jgi:hypothetical protein
MGKEPVREALEALAQGRWDEFVKSVSSIKINTWEDAVTATMDAIASGTSILLDDIRDLGRLDRPHHWIWGLLLVLAGIFLLPILIIYYGDWSGARR